MVVLAAWLFVHSFYDEYCCNNKDCHPVPCGEITTVPGIGWKWQDLVFGKNTLRSSPDGNCHVCVIDKSPYYEFKSPRCVYLPSRV
jgi:hypothetical protein